jgi:ATP-dependent Clp protease ATP-binding subunit ClpC
VGFRPEFGARELRRLIRSELETELAREMLSGRIEDGDKVRVAWTADDQKITFQKLESAGETETPEVPGKADSEEAEPASE